MFFFANANGALGENDLNIRLANHNYLRAYKGRTRQRLNIRLHTREHMHTCLAQVCVCLCWARTLSVARHNACVCVDAHFSTSSPHSCPCTPDSNFANSPAATRRRLSLRHPPIGQKAKFRVDGCLRRGRHRRRKCDDDEERTVTTTTTLPTTA